MEKGEHAETKQGEGSRKRHNKAYYTGAFKKKRTGEYYGPGMSGFLITCDNKKEKFAIREAYSLLNEYADHLYGPEELEDEKNSNSNDEEAEELSVEAELKKEIESMKEMSKKERRFQAVDTKVKHNIFIRAKAVNVNKLADAIFNDLLNRGEKRTRHCMRFLPVNQTCNASIEKISQVSKSALQDIKEENEGRPFTVHIQYKERFNNTLKKDDVIRNLVSAVRESGEGNMPVLKNGNYTLDINILKNTCAVSILKEYDKYKKYNLQSFGAESGPVNETRDSTVKSPDTLENNNNRNNNEIDVVSSSVPAENETDDNSSNVKESRLTAVT